MFGLMLGLTFFTAAVILYKELKRKEGEGLLIPITSEEMIGTGARWTEVILNGLFGLVVGLKFPLILGNFEAFKNDAAGVIFSGQGNWLTGILGLILFGGFTFWQGNKEKLAVPKKVLRSTLPSQRIGDITVIAAIFGLLGARLFSILENLDSFWQDPLGQLLSGSGLTIYGGLILAFLANYLFVKRHKIPPIHVMDGIAPALILGYAVGRLGCQLSGDGDWGIINELAKPNWVFFPDWMWSYDYPHNVLNEGIGIEGCTDRYCKRLSTGVFPTPIYEILASIIIFFILWVLRKRIKFTGFIFFLYAMLMSVERFFIEYIRVNPRYDFLGQQLSQAQIISIGIFIVGIAGMYYWYQRRDRPVIMKAE